MTCSRFSSRRVMASLSSCEKICTPLLLRFSFRISTTRTTGIFARCDNYGCSGNVFLCVEYGTYPDNSTPVRGAVMVGGAQSHSNNPTCPAGYTTTGLIADCRADLPGCANTPSTCCAGNIAYCVQNASASPGDTVVTNIVMVDVRGAFTAAELAAKLAEADVLVFAIGPRRIRAVTNLNVSSEDCRRAGELFCSCAAQLSSTAARSQA